MADGITVKLEGVDALQRALREAATTIRTKAVRAALRDAANVIKRQAQINAPILKTPKANRKPGTVRRAISVRASKFARRDGNEGVYVSVRPLRGKRQIKLGKAGNNNPNDPFYWQFVEFGTKPHVIKSSPRKAMTWYAGPTQPPVVKQIHHPGTQPVRFMTRAADTKGQAAVEAFMQRVVPQIEKINLRANRVR